MARKVEFVTKTELRVEGIIVFMKRKVVRYGTAAGILAPGQDLWIKR